MKILYLLLISCFVVGCVQSTSISTSYKDELYADCDAIPGENSEPSAISIQQPMCLLGVAHNASLSVNDAFTDLKERSPRFYAALEANNKLDVLKQKYESTSNTKVAVSAMLAEIS
jgi:hypothetical protein